MVNKVTNVTAMTAGIAPRYSKTKENKAKSKQNKAKSSKQKSVAPVVIASAATEMRTRAFILLVLQKE